MHAAPNFRRRRATAALTLTIPGALLVAHAVAATLTTSIIVVAAILAFPILSGFAAGVVWEATREDRERGPFEVSR